MRRFMKRRSNSKSSVDKVVNSEAEFIDQLVKSNSPTRIDEDSGYGERDRLQRKSLSYEELLAVGSYCQNRRRQSTTLNETIRTDKKTTSSSSSIASEEHSPQRKVRPYLCSVNIDGKGQCHLTKDDYDYDEITLDKEPVKYRPKSSVHLKLSRNQSDTFRYQNVALRRLSGDLTLPVLDDLEYQKVEEAYEEALKYGAVDVTYVRLMLIGLPEAGKTTTRYSLMGEKAPGNLSRTKLVEPCQKPIRRQLAITGKSGWSYINHDQEDEDLAILLNRLMSCNEAESRICSQKSSCYQDPCAPLQINPLRSIASDTDVQCSPVMVNVPRNEILTSRSNSLSPVNVLPLPPKPLNNKCNTIPAQLKSHHEYTKGCQKTGSLSTDEIYEDIDSRALNDSKSSTLSHCSIPLASSLQRGESPQDVHLFTASTSLTSTTTSQLDTPTLHLQTRTQSVPLAKSIELSTSSSDLSQRKTSNSKTPDAGKLQTKFLEQGSKFRQKIKRSVISMLKEQDGLDFCSDCDNEVLINIWDCGGQFVFREILPAFLAQKVAYLLIYDASKDLEEVYKEPGTYPGCYAEGNTFQHLQKWMAAIHAHSTLLLPSASLYPRMLVIGTHGDALKTEEGSYEAAKQKIISDIKSYFKGKRFADLILAHFIVDNTTGGEGYNQEDPSFELIRCQVEDYAKQSLTISTPISWVLFRRVFQATITEAGIPVVSMSLAKEIAMECKIDEDTLSQVLLFYHQVGLLLHYASVPILDDVVIADPQWLVNSLSMLFTLPSTDQEELGSLWTQLHEKGVLEKALYESIWCNCGIDPQGLLNLLEYFLLAAPIKHGAKKLFSDSAYFVPSLLHSWASEEDSSTFEDAVEIAAPLFLVFNTEYVPPGFFIRLAASFSGVDGVEIMFDSGIYRNRITFAIGEADELTMVENLESIKITLARYFHYHDSSSRQFSQACQNAKQNLLACCYTITQQWMPGVKAITAFQCEKPQCSDKPPHYIHFDNTIKLCLRCSHSKVRTQPSQAQKLWLQPPNPVADSKDEGITTKLLSKVAVKLNATKLEHLACHLGIDSFQYDAIKEDNNKHYERAMAVLKEWYNMGKGGLSELYQSLQETGHHHAARLLPVKRDSALCLTHSLTSGQFNHLPMNISAGSFASHFQHRQMSFRKKYHTPTTSNCTKELSLSVIVQISSKIHDENKLLVLAVLLGFTEQEFFDMQYDYHTTYLLALHMVTKWWKKYSGSYSEFSEYLKAAGLGHTLP